jgi:hypothetical protein
LISFAAIDDFRQQMNPLAMHLDEFEPFPIAQLVELFMQT